MQEDDRIVLQVEEALVHGSWKKFDSPFFKVPNASHYIKGHILKFDEMPGEETLAFVQFDTGIGRTTAWIAVGALFRKSPIPVTVIDSAQLWKYVPSRNS